MNDPPRGDLETMMLSTRLADGQAAPEAGRGARRRRGSRCPSSPTSRSPAIERAYFLRILYRNPIDKGRITSLYGWRSDPFTGSREFHGGLDIGAPEGTRRARGTRRDRGRGRARTTSLGNFVVLTHPGGYQTVYGHLSPISVTIGEQVSTGSILGAVGHTGRATGPHLHFEVRTKAGTRDPLQLIRMK